MESEYSDDPAHPADRLILEKAAKSEKGSAEKKVSETPKFEFKAGGLNGKGLIPSSDKSRKKRQRSPSSSDASLEDRNLQKKARAESLSINLNRGDSGSESEREKKPKWDFKPPRGVIMVDDDAEGQLNMQRKLRAPRYFSVNKFDESSKKCFNCGLTGHFSRDCPNASRDRPCQICAKFDHPDFLCPYNKQRCYKCNKFGHFARECTFDASLALPIICTKCGDPKCRASNQPDYVRAEGGCTEHYSGNDLALVRCNKCFKLGHINCHEATAILPKKTCCCCGERRHFGYECSQEQTYQVNKERQESGVLRGMDSRRFSESENERRGGRYTRDFERDNTLSQRGSFQDQGYRSDAAWQQQDRYLPSSDLGQSSSQFQAPALPDLSQSLLPPQPSYTLPPQYSGYQAVPPQYQANSLRSYPSHPPQPPAPITLPPPAEFRHNNQPFAMGADRPGGRREGRSRRHKR